VGATQPYPTQATALNYLGNEDLIEGSVRKYAFVPFRQRAFLLQNPSNPTAFKSRAHLVKELLTYRTAEICYCMSGYSTHRL
jgi:hypothetical protein